MFVSGLKRMGFFWKLILRWEVKRRWKKKTLEVPAVCLISFFITYIYIYWCRICNTDQKSIAKELGITPAQLYISWQVQRGVLLTSRLDILILEQSIPDVCTFPMFADRCASKKCDSIQDRGELSKVGQIFQIFSFFFVCVNSSRLTNCGLL